MDRLEAMSALLAAVETGSLSAAGRKLGMPLPTVSRKISELETHLNTRLLVRSTRRLSLTDAGSAYVSACRNILEQVGEAERAAAGEFTNPVGDLVVAAPIVFGRLHVLPSVVEFLAAFPSINVRLLLSDRNADLIDDHIDVAIRIGSLPDSGLVATHVGDVHRVVCASPAFLSAHGAPKAPSDLPRLSCITFEGLGSRNAWTFARKNSKTPLTIAIEPRLSVTTAEAAIDAAISGVGVTQVLSYQVADHVEAGQLQIVLREFQPGSVPVNLVHLGQTRQARKVRVFLDHLVPRLRQRLRDPA